MKNSTKDLGNYGEKLALTILKQKKIVPFMTNWTCFAGEIDIIGRENNDLVFVEVKTRYDTPFSRKHLTDSINFQKKKKLKTLSQLFLKKYYFNTKWPNYRIDLIGLLIGKDDEKLTYVKHIQGAINNL